MLAKRGTHPILAPRMMEEIQRVTLCVQVCCIFVLAPCMAVAETEPGVGAAMPPDSAQTEREDSPSKVDPITQTIQSEVTRRENIVMFSQRAITEGSQLYAAGEYESAANRFRYALSNLPHSEQTRQAYQNAAFGLVNANNRIAQTALEAKEYEKARNAVSESLSFAPESKKLQGLLREINLASGDEVRNVPFYSKTYSDKVAKNLGKDPVIMTPEFIKTIDKVSELLYEGDRFRDSGQYDLADNRYQQMLRFDPYNETARRSLQRLDTLKAKYYRQAKAHSRDEMLYQIEKGWSTEPSRSVGMPKRVTNENPAAISGVVALEERLDTGIVDKVSLEESSIQDALVFLRQKFADINFVLKATLSPTAGDTADAAAQTARIPTITLSVENIPLAEVLRLICQQTNLTYKVEQFAVLIAPQSENLEELYTREFAVPPGFIPAIPPNTENMAEAVQNQQKEVRSRLEGMGVTFNTGATVSYLGKQGKLVVRNTLDILDLVEQALATGDENATTDAARQVRVDARFMEVNQTDLDELSFRWNMNRRGTTQGIQFDGSYVPTDTPGLRSATSAAAMASNTANGAPLDLSVANNVLRNIGEQGLISMASQQSLILGNAFQTGMTLMNTKLEVLLNALSQKTGTDVMAAPSVVTQFGRTANIFVGREFFHPDPENPPQPPQISQLPVTVSATLTGYAFTPPTPNFNSEPTKLGVTLEVTPNRVSGSGNEKVLDLTITPTVKDFDGFINYGSSINYIDPVSITVAGVAIQNVINIPIFNERSVETKAYVEDGQTILLGGLMREDLQEVHDKIPLLGDLPLIGKVFQSNIEQSIKRNLLVFVTPTLLNSQGDPAFPINREDSQSFSNAPKFTKVARVQPLPPPDPRVQEAPADEIQAVSDDKNVMGDAVTQGMAK